MEPTLAHLADSVLGSLMLLMISMKTWEELEASPTTDTNIAWCVFQVGKGTHVASQLLTSIFQIDNVFGAKVKMN